MPIPAAGISPVSSVTFNDWNLICSLAVSCKLSVIDSGCNLQLYSVNNITGGTDSQGEVTVRVDKDGRIVNGRGSDTDIIAASAKAYINALNRALEKTTRAHPQI